MIQFQLAESRGGNKPVGILFTSAQPDFASFGLTDQDIQLIGRFKEAKKYFIPFYSGQGSRFIQLLEPKDQDFKTLEWARKAGATLATELKSNKTVDISLETDGSAEILLAYAEGLALGSYQFEKYKSEKSGNNLRSIALSHPGIQQEDIAKLQALVEANFFARDLVNEPGCYLTAERLGEEITELGKTLGFKTEVFNKTKIEALKMGGLLAVNAGSPDPPTFSILEYKPENAINTRPYIFVGKGVVFDTGGLTLKPTPGSMDQMKSDMAGAAAVIGLFYAVTKIQLPVHIIGLIPSTDNRPGESAVFPGDIIRMFDTTSVEVLNTDAEGRLILADALAYAKKYEPELVVDLATLTGAAARALGPFGIIYMSTADADINKTLEQSGNNTYERLVQLPLWEEYAELIKSDIADLKNVSPGGYAGAITAGKFLEHFTDFPWMHLDIATMAFLTSPDSYRGKNATGVGVRLLFDFLMNLSRKNERA